MQASSINQGREISKDELLKIAPFSKGQLTKIYRAGYLPRPQRRSRPGSNKPVYFWDESVVEQATLVYDLLQVSRADHWVRLALWLWGYQVDFAPIRQRWLDAIDAYLQAFTQGEADNPLDNITDAVSQLESKWEHTPTRHRPEPLRRFGLEGYAQWMELFLDVLLVPELDVATFAEVLAVLQMMDTTGGDTRLQEQFAEDALPWLQTFQEILAFPRLREALEQATPKEWEQARIDYVTLCQFFRNFFAPVAHIHPVPEEMYVLLFAAGGFYLVPVALAIRYWGRGDWIDDAFAWASGLLNDPDTQAWLAEQLAKSPG